MYYNQKVKDLINTYYFNVPNETHAESFERAKANAMADLKSMKVEDFKRKI